jgi:rRNA maturation endonuclease Nob1
VTDSLRKAIEARDRRFNTDRELYLTQRPEARARRVCGRCWRMLDDDPKQPARTCPECGSTLHEVSV